MDWFRMYHEFASDAKVQSMSEAMQRRLLMLLCLRCSNTLETLQHDELAFALRISDDELSATKDLFVRKNFINEEWEILQWDKRQFVSDSSAPRVKRHREKKKEEAKKTLDDAAKALKKPPCNVTLTPQNRTDTDTDTDKSTSTASSSCDDVRQCPTGTLVNLYHELMPMNPRVKVLSKSRRSAIRARWLEAAALDCEPFGYTTKSAGLVAWRRFFEICSESKFLSGLSPPQAGKPAFVADIDFIFSASGFAKTLENKYHRDAT